MMKKGIFWIFIALLLCTARLPAQLTPGYLGKRVAVHGDIFTMTPLGTGVATRNYKGNKEGIVDGSLFFNTRFQAGVDLTLSKSLVLGVAWDYFRTGVEETFGIDYNWTLEAKGPALRLRMYPFLLQGSLAPLGTYFEVGSTLHLLDSELDVAGDSTLKYEGMRLSFLASIGRTVALADPILFDFGFQLGFLGVTVDEGPQGSLPSPVPTRIKDHLLLNFRFGLHILLF